MRARFLSSLGAGSGKRRRPRLRRQEIRAWAEEVDDRVVQINLHYLFEIFETLQQLSESIFSTQTVFKHFIIFLFLLNNYFQFLAQEIRAWADEVDDQVVQMVQRELVVLNEAPARHSRGE